MCKGSLWWYICCTKPKVWAWVGLGCAHKLFQKLGVKRFYSAVVTLALRKMDPVCISVWVHSWLRTSAPVFCNEIMLCGCGSGFWHGNRSLAWYLIYALFINLSHVSWRTWHTVGSFLCIKLFVAVWKRAGSVWSTPSTCVGLALQDK